MNTMPRMVLMKKMLFCLAVVLLVGGCINLTVVPCPAARADAAAVIYPLPDATMENLTDAILSVSFEAGDVYLDDTGKLQMNVKIYTHDQYDLVDIALLQVGDTLVTHAGEVAVLSVERMGDGTVSINGGWEADGLSLMTHEGGVYYAVSANDAKDWYEIGEATIRVSADFIGYDQADLELGEVIFYPGSFLVGEVINYDFTPYNTTIRVEAGQVMELHRVYMP